MAMMHELTRLKATAAVIFVSFLLLYAATSSHGVILDHDDAAEFQTIGVIGGVPHQPYPFWLLIARAFALIPVGEPAFRITFLSNVAAAASLAVLFLLLTRYLPLGPSCVAAISLGLSMTFWQNATVAEVYALNTLLMLALCASVLRWWRTRRPRDWLLACLCLGLFISYHQINIAAVAPLLLLRFWYRREIQRHVTLPQRMAGAILFAAPFLLYLTTYVADRQYSPMNWYDNLGRYDFEAAGNSVDHFGSFWQRLRFQLNAERFGTLTPSMTDIASRLLEWVRNVRAFEFPFLSTLLILLGMIGAVAHRRTLLVALAFIVPTVVMAVIAADGVTKNAFAMNTLVVLSAFMALGIARGLRVVRHSALRRGVCAAVAIVVIATAAVRLSTSLSALARGFSCNFRCVSASEVLWHLPASNDHGAMYADWFAANMPPNSLVFAKWPEANVLLYHTLVKQELDGVYVTYILPTSEMMEQKIDEIQPESIFLTFPPEQRGFTSAAQQTVIPGRSVFRIDPTGAERDSVRMME
jgi:hypothetical protein